MDNYFKETLSELEEAIGNLEFDADSLIQRSEAVIHLIVECLSKLKEYILRRGFNTIDEEIYFF